VTEIHGVCDERFEAVRKALAESLDQDDVGACAAVYVDGEPVADLWGGYADAERTAAWERDTITNVWSTTKTMVTLCALILADRGDLDLAAPVARYWPEFAAAGKQDVQVRHVLAHTAGLPDFDGPVTAGDLCDWTAVTTRLAAQAPRWEPGTLAGYHSLTQGFVVGEVIRRITGRLPGVFFAEEVAGPLGADFHIGLPAEHDHRVAPVIAHGLRHLRPLLRLGRVGRLAGDGRPGRAHDDVVRDEPDARPRPGRLPRPWNRDGGLRGPAVTSGRHQTWWATSATSSSLRCWVSSLIRLAPIETGENPHWVDSASRSRPT
jgi:CubicO group peptidase (beta-lactamase class C family)